MKEMRLLTGAAIFPPVVQRHKQNCLVKGLYIRKPLRRPTRLVVRYNYALAYAPWLRNGPEACLHKPRGLFSEAFAYDISGVDPL